MEDRPNQAARKPREHRKFVIQNVAAGVRDDFLSVLGQKFDANCVTHCPGGDKKGGFFARYGRRAFFEAIDRGVFAVDVVPHFGFRHGAAHSRRGAGNSVAAEVNHAAINSWNISFETMIPRGGKPKPFA